MLVPLDPQIETSQPATDEPAQVRQSAGSLLLSLAFWTTLTAAAGLLATAQLAPALVRWNDAQQLKQRNAVELTQLEAELSRLERLELALETDPHFAATIRAGHHSIDSSGQLLNHHPASLNPSTSSPQPEQSTAPADSLPTNPRAIATPANSFSGPQSHISLPRIPPFQQILNQTLLPTARQISAHPPLIRKLLWTAAALTLFAFTCLNTTAATTTLTLIKLPLTTATTLHHRYAPRSHHFPTNPPEPVADPSVPGIINNPTRSDSSVGRATDS